MADRFKVLHDDGAEDWLTREEMLASLDVQGGAIDPLEIGELVAGYLQAHPPAAGVAGRSVQFSSAQVPWTSPSVVGKVAVDYRDCNPAWIDPATGRPSTKVGKFTSQGFYVPGGLSWFYLSIVMGVEVIHSFPMPGEAGGEFEWRLPWGHRRARPGEPDISGYFKFWGGVYYADHPRTVPCVGMIRTEAPNICYVSLRCDEMAILELEEKGVLNRIRPFGKWTDGSQIWITGVYPTE